MNKIILYSLLFFMPVRSMDDSMMLTTIYSPIPLIELPYQKETQYNYTLFIKKMIFPLTGCVYLSLKKNDLLNDIMQNPYTTAIMMYTLTHYSLYQLAQYQQNRMHEEIINTMRHVFHLLIIGHGIYNKIISSSDHMHKIASIAIDTSTFLLLQLFLHNAYNTWFILFSYYQEHYPEKILFAYKTNQISFFDVLQATCDESDILPFITDFYDKNNTSYNYAPILNCLELKLKSINQKLHKLLSM